MYRFPKNGKNRTIAVCGGGRISAPCALVIGTVLAQRHHEGVDELAVEVVPLPGGSLIEDVEQSGAVIQAAGSDGGDTDIASGESMLEVARELKRMSRHFAGI